MNVGKTSWRVTKDVWQIQKLALWNVWHFPGKVTLTYIEKKKHRMSKREGSLEIISPLYKILLVERTEAQRRERTYPRSHSQEVAAGTLAPRFSDSRSRSPSLSAFLPSFLLLPLPLCLVPNWVKSMGGKITFYLASEFFSLFSLSLGGWQG